MLVTVSGLPGSGTTTAARLVASRLGIDHLDGGAVFRQLAGDHAMEVGEFGRYVEAHPGIDVELDVRLAARARAGGCVLESRLAGWVATNEGVDAVRVWVACEEPVRASRVAKREGYDAERALSANRAREASERRRYLELYGIDLDDLSIYELVLDSGTMAPEAIADVIVEAATGRFGAGGGGW